MLTGTGLYSKPGENKPRLLGFLSVGVGQNKHMFKTKFVSGKDPPTVTVYQIPFRFTGERQKPCNPSMMKSNIFCV